MYSKHNAQGRLHQKPDPAPTGGPINPGDWVLVKWSASCWEGSYQLLLSTPTAVHIAERQTMDHTLQKSTNASQISRSIHHARIKTVFNNCFMYDHNCIPYFKYSDIRPGMIK